MVSKRFDVCFLDLPGLLSIDVVTGSLFEATTSITWTR